ncbi:hypothetical protein [Amycolatopsis sp. H20-H5]|uniref:hypothetical protein n=1 Tax=Amycolatopsis sp. H20-H5 TaxID=3046309 RepID=UPI002DBF1A90|nr:hypothetical protein [Amycolatopsis sp. H20-H5]MEC3975114.1 hypothetical protein [Amycolatopsis sp. H20-H5]
MAEHAESSEKAEREAPPKRADINWGKTREQVFSVLASIARWVGLVFAALLVLHIIFVIGEANGDNGIVSFVRGWADSLTLGFKDMFTPADAKLRVLINYGIAAVFWLVVSVIVARILRRIGSSVG